MTEGRATGPAEQRGLRVALSAVTFRGRCFLAAGILCILAAEILGLRDLDRVGILLLVLPLVSLAIVVRTRYQLKLDRSLTPARVPADTSARVRLRLENTSRLPSGTLLMEDVLPFALGARPRFVVSRVQPGGVREATYSVRSDARGRYQIGPLTVRITDPFGCVELGRSFAATDTLTVSPVITPLPPVRLGGDWRGGGEGSASQVAVSGEADVATREYRSGDDLRSVHWRSTAKRGELMVRREEQPRQNRATLLLDTRRSAHRGDGAGSSFEWAVSATASIGVWLAHRGYGLRLLTTTDEGMNGSSVVVAEAMLLDALSVVRASRERELGRVAHQLRGAGPAGASSRLQAGGLLIAILGSCDEESIRSLAQAAPSGSTAVAVLLDAARWGVSAHRGRDTAEAALARTHDALAVAGWRPVVARFGDNLATLWPDVGRRPTDVPSMAPPAGRARAVAP